MRGDEVRSSGVLSNARGAVTLELGDVHASKKELATAPAQGC